MWNENADYDACGCPLTCRQTTLSNSSAAAYATGNGNGFVCYNTGGASARYYQIYVRNVLPLMSRRPRLRDRLPETSARETITTKYVPVKFQFKNHRRNRNGNFFHNIRPLEKVYRIRRYAFFPRPPVWVSTRGPHIFSLKIRFIPLTPLLFEGLDTPRSIRSLDV